MKKAYLLVFTLLLSLWVLSDVSANETTAWTTVTVTEKIPGAWCEAEDPDDPSTTYTCTIKPWFGTVVNMMGWIIKYFTFLAGLFGVLFIIVNGIMYSMSGIDAGMKDEAKKRIIATLLGLVVLLLSWVILNIIAPWIYR